MLQRSSDADPSDNAGNARTGISDSDPNDQGGHGSGSTGLTDNDAGSCADTGGYGRGVMAPSSDTDLLFLRAYKASPHTESVIEYMLYALWDMGLKVGNAFRTPMECVKQAQEDVTIKTSLLDSRFICGDQDLARDMVALFQREAVKGNDAQFIADKLAERDARHARMGDARYVVEPNLKEGKGGLRDLQTLYWIGKYVHRVQNAGTSIASLRAAVLARLNVPPAMAASTVLLYEDNLGLMV